MLADNINSVRSRIEVACRRAGRDPSSVKLVAVSKTHPPDVIRTGVAAGLTVFGENKVQEAEPKIIELGREHLEWHLMGHLQSNKARRAVQLFDKMRWKRLRTRSTSTSMIATRCAALPTCSTTSNVGTKRGITTSGTSNRWGTRPKATSANA